MTVLVGYIPHKGGRGSLDLAMQFAYTLGLPLTVVTVVPRQWLTPSLAKVDAEFVEYARQLGERSELQAREYLRETSVAVDIDYRTVAGRSVTSALLEAAEECDASLLVLGSSTGGAIGRIVVGTTTDKLLHVSPIPLALSPRGYRSTAANGFGRLTCAFSDAAESENVVQQAVRWASSLNVPTRVASFGVRGKTMYPPPVGLTAEDSVLDSWLEQASAAQSRLRLTEVIGEDTETVIATGTGWAESLASIDWRDDEVLVLGSSTLGPVARVFLGSRASKLIGSSPVPVVVVPRGYKLEIAAPDSGDVITPDQGDEPAPTGR